MTVNEMIEALKNSGDEQWRDVAEVEILDANGIGIFSPSEFDLRHNIRTLDINTNIVTAIRAYDDIYDDDEYDDWDIDEDDEVDDEVDDDEND